MPCAKPPPAAALQVQVDKDVFMQMKAVFDEAPFSHALQTNALDEDAFVQKFTTVFDAGPTRAQLRTWFRRIDVHSKGVVTWDMVSSYLLLEQSGTKAEESAQEINVQSNCPSRHHLKGMITKIWSHRKTGLISSETCPPPNQNVYPGV